MIIAARGNGMNEFVKERDAAFADFVLTGSTKKLRKYCNKYGIPMPRNKKVLAAGVYKAVCATTSISNDIKDVAFQKCLELGFSPFIAPPEGRQDE